MLITFLSTISTNEVPTVIGHNIKYTVTII